MFNDVRISTITEIGNLSEDINLNELFNTLEINDTVRYIEYGDMPPKGISNKKKKKKKTEPKGKRKKYFYNQVSIQIYIGKIVNIKLFNNGAFQMTGLKTEEMGYGIISYLINLINSKNIIKNNLKLTKKRIVLINSDFDIGFRINNPILHRLIIDNNIHSSYESCIYPGVNIKYYHNPIINNSGICDCEQPCNGKGKDNTCKKITIAVFKSGKIIITGGRTTENINTAYDFITNFINSHKSKIQVK